MGNELSGILRGSGGAKMKADVGSDTVTFRGAWKGEVPFEEITVEVRGTLLLLSFRGVEVEVGAGAKANQVASQIRSPPSRLDRLGVEYGVSAAVAGALDPSFKTELGTRAVVAPGAPKQPVDVLFYGIEAAAGLELLPKLAPLVAPAGTLWVVFPQTVQESVVAAAARAAGLVAKGVRRFGDGRNAAQLTR